MIHIITTGIKNLAIEKKLISMKMFCLASILLANAVSATVINFNNDYALVTDVTGTDVGDVYRFGNVTNQNGAIVDALMTITGSSLSEAGFNGVESVLDTDVRWRLADEAGYVTIRVDFVQVGVNTLITNPLTDITVLFDDIDSDSGRNGSDFAGVKTSDIDAIYLNDITNLTINSSLVNGYSIAHLAADGLGTDTNDFREWGNNTASDVNGQSVSAAAFTIDAASSFEFVIGQLGPEVGYRHMDLDLTPDFTLTNPVIIPEPGSMVLVCCASVMLLVTSRRRKPAVV